ncbi:MAG TPA: SPOR domain-containing protein [Burkholderiales bacterium]
MKWLFFLLLAANLIFGGYAYLREHAPNPDAQLTRMQLNADQLRIVPPREKPVAPPPAPLATAAPSACMEWGSFGSGELPRAQVAVDRLALGNRIRRTDVSVTAGYWVYIPPLKSKADMDRKAGELKDLGVLDYYPVLETGRWRYAISLGIFRSEEGARRYLASLREKGVRSATVGKREQRVNQTAFLVRDPTEEDSANLAVLRSEFPGTELRATECPVS